VTLQGVEGKPEAGTAPARGIMNRLQHRLTWRTLADIALAVVAAFVVAGVTDIVLSYHWQPRVRAFGAGEAFYNPWSAVGVIAGLGAVLVGAGFILGMDRQYHNWLIVAAGAGMLTLGTSYAATERVTITPEEFTVRRCWGLRTTQWRYDELERIVVVTHSGRRGYRWVTVRYVRKPGSGTSEEVGAPRFLPHAQFTLHEQAAAKGASVAAVLESR
jgi:hypothetical protein